MQPQYFPFLPVSPPIAAVFRRLGMPHDPHIAQELTQLFGSLTLRGALLRLDIHQTKEDIRLANGDHIPSVGVATLLRGCTQAVYLASSVQDIAPRCAALQAAGSMRTALLLDAVAAQTADAGLGALQKLLGAQLLRCGLQVTPARFSAGYGDLPLHYQRTLYNALQLHVLGIDILDSCMLRPEKTVLAIAGIRKVAQPSFDPR